MTTATSADIDLIQQLDKLCDELKEHHRNLCVVLEPLTEVVDKLRNYCDLILDITSNCDDLQRDLSPEIFPELNHDAWLNANDIPFDLSYAADSLESTILSVTRLTLPPLKESKDD